MRAIRVIVLSLGILGAAAPAAAAASAAPPHAAKPLIHYHA